MSYLRSPLSLYIHWPYCLSKCPYCDFNSHVAQHVDHREWLDAYLKQIAQYQHVIEQRKIQSIFFGGGTPSLMDPFVVEKLIKTFDADVEITLEANPTSIEIQKFKDFKNAGINRISVGIQALNDEDLKFLGRTHSVSEALKGLEIAISLFDNVSFDLIYARPKQTLEQWERELAQALSFGTKHLSLYQLTIEKNTPFFAWHQKGRFQLPQDELSFDLYKMTERKALEYGLKQYEISNYAKKDFESKHNLTYWNYLDYLGIGPGAHSRLTIEGQKWGIEQIKAPLIWMSSLQENRVLITKEQEWVEKMMMGLRLKKGFIVDFKLNEKVCQLIDLGLLIFHEGMLVSTDEGFLKLNSIMEYVVS